MKEKLISIIIPCFNSEKYIDRCIRSVVRQTIGVDLLQIICVDDASIDYTWERLQVWEKRFPDSILLIPLPENIKQGGARNEGLKYAEGKYIGFVDSDDWIEDDMYERLYNHAITHCCDMVCSQFVRDTGKSDFDKRKLGEDLYVSITNHEERKAFLMMGGLGCTCSRLIRKSVIDEHNILFPIGLVYEDNYFMALLNMYVKSVYIMQDVLYHYFVNMESTVMKKDSFHHLDRMKIELMKLDAYKEMGVYELYIDEIEYSFLRLYYVNTMNLLLLRFESFPEGIFDNLRNTVLTLFPDYKNNPYLDSFHEVEQAILQTIEIEYDMNGLNALAERYKELYHWN